MKANIVETTIQEEVSLPSAGKLYANVPEKIILRSMTTNEEKLRLGSKGSFFYTMSKIINNCIVGDHDYDAYDFALFDFVYLMYKLRVITYGSEYKVEVKCPSCGAISTVKINLDDLKLNFMTDEQVEPIKIGPLPRSKAVLNCKYISARDLDEINDKALDIKHKNPDYQGDPAYQLRLKKAIVSINGEETTPSKLDKFIEEMLLMDARYYQDKYDSIDVGYDFDVSSKCQLCGNNIDFSLPIQDEFFRPTFD